MNAAIEAATGRATAIDLFNFSRHPMRAFHLTWFAFFLCFFGWFGIAPLMAVVREDLHLTRAQIGNTIIASVAITILARLAIGYLCDRIGPRKAYTWLLALGSIPVMGIGLARDYETFLLMRLAIGAIGASFVITQYHTSMMFAPNVVGTANATTAGWGNLGGGVTQMVMPLILAGFVSLGVSETLGWRLAMILPGALLLVVAVAYYLLTQDTPRGNFSEVRKNGGEVGAAAGGGSFLEAARDVRVWALFVLYAACFGVELTINNVAALYFHDRFELSVTTAGLIASLFGLMNLFARTLGGVVSDFFAGKIGLRGRVVFLGIVTLLEGIALVVFAGMSVLPVAVLAMVVFSLFVQMAEGATFGVVPFINKKALGSVAGIVGAGGNVGAVAAGFLFKSEALNTQQALHYLGLAVIVGAFFALAVRFSPAVEEEENRAFSRAAGGRKRQEAPAMAAATAE